MGTRRRTVAVLAYDGMTTFETGIVTGVFGMDWSDRQLDWYELMLCAPSREPLAVIGGATLAPRHGTDELADADTVIVPGVTDPHVDPAPEVVAALRRAHRRGARMVSICNGTFALAAAGLLDGRTVTTHWRYTDLLRDRYPAVEVDPGPLYLDDGDVVTGAGGAAGLDVCLHLVRTDFGAAVANSVARRLVIPPHREGGQAQYIEAPVGADPEDNPISQSLVWARERLGEPITVEAMARIAHMSTRTYLRHFGRCVGTSPMRWLIQQRVYASLPLLETTAMPVERIASVVGFETPVTFRHHFHAMMRTSPSAYRRSFTTETEQGCRVWGCLLSW